MKKQQLNNRYKQAIETAVAANFFFIDNMPCDMIKSAITMVLMRMGQATLMYDEIYDEAYSHAYECYNSLYDELEYAVDFLTHCQQIKPRL